MAIFTQRIQHNYDDGRTINESAWSDNYLQMGYYTWDLSFSAGVRFNLDIPKNSTIINATITFTAKFTMTNDSPNLTIYGINEDNTPNLLTTPYIYSRPRTSASVLWSPGQWTAGNEYATPNLKDIVQEIINRSGWAKNNAVAFYLKASLNPDGYREAYDYSNNSSKAALLTVEYTQSTNIKNINGLSYNNIKTINNLAISSIKNVNGLA